MTLLDERPACTSCGCKARHTQDTSTPQIMWCERCTACCWTGKEPEMVQRVVLGTIDFGFGWAGAQLRRWMRSGRAA